MPVFSVNTLHSTGHFKLSFAPNKQKNFYGLSLNEFEVFRSYGSLPHNNIASNKIINAIGQNLLYLEEQASRLAENASDSDDHQDQLFYNQLERLGNAMAIRIFTALSTLETTKFTHDVVVEQRCYQEIIGIYEHYLSTLQHLPMASDRLKNSRLERLIKSITQQKLTWQERVKTAPVLSNETLRSLYQDTLNDFQIVQQEITLYQRIYMGDAEFSNQSSTEAYQNASYALEAHLFGDEEPSNEQLWKFDDSNRPIVVCTKTLSTPTPDLILKAGILAGIDGLPAFFSLEECYLDLKHRIQRSDEEARKNNRIVGYNAKYDDERKKVLDTQDQLEAYLLNLCQHQTIEDNVLQSKPVKTIEHRDFFSLFGSICQSFPKYFEREMAAKHPVMTTCVYLTSATAFMAAGLGSIGIAPHIMKEITCTLSKIFTINGYVGVTPLQLQQAIEGINSIWMTTTNANFFDLIVKNGFILPKIIYFLSGHLLDGIDRHDSLSVLLRETFPDQLTSDGTLNDLRAVLTKLAIIGLVFGVSYGLEEGLFYVEQGLATHGYTTASEVIAAPTAIAQAIGFYHSIADELVSILLLTLALKSTGMIFNNHNGLLEKIVDSYTQTTQQLDLEERQTLILMIRLYNLYHSDYRTFNQVMNDFKFSESRKKIYHSLARKNLIIFHAFEGELDFLKAVGLNRREHYSTLDWSIRFIPGLILGSAFAMVLILPIILIIGSICSEKFHQKLTRLTGSYDGAYLYDLSNIVLSYSKYVAGGLIGLFGLIPILLCPPLVFSQHYQQFLFGKQYPVIHHAKIDHEIFMNQTVIRSGVLGAARFLIIGLIRNVFFPLYGLIAVVLAAGFVVLNMLGAIIGASVWSCVSAQHYHDAFNTLMKPATALMRSHAIHEGLKIPLIALPRMSMIVFTPIKLIVMSLGETIKRLFMMLIEVCFYGLLILNTLLTPKQRLQGVKALIATVYKPMIYMVLLPILYIAAELKALVIGLKKGREGWDGFFDTFMIARRRSLARSWFAQVKHFYAALTLSLYQSDHAHQLIDQKETLLLSLLSSYALIKNKWGQVMRLIRNTCMRKPEEYLQRTAFKHEHHHIPDNKEQANVYHSLSAHASTRPSQLSRVRSLHYHDFFQPTTSSSEEKVDEHHKTAEYSQQ